jgi:hypothetical protein
MPQVSGIRRKLESEENLLKIFDTQKFLTQGSTEDTWEQPSGKIRALENFRTKFVAVGHQRLTAYSEFSM